MREETPLCTIGTPQQHCAGFTVFSRGAGILCDRSGHQSKRRIFLLGKSMIANKQPERTLRSGCFDSKNLFSRVERQPGKNIPHDLIPIQFVEQLMPCFGVEPDSQVLDADVVQIFGNGRESFSIPSPPGPYCRKSAASADFAAGSCTRASCWSSIAGKLNPDMPPQ